MTLKIELKNPTNRTTSENKECSSTQLSQKASWLLALSKLDCGMVFPFPTMRTSSNN